VIRPHKVNYMFLVPVQVINFLSAVFINSDINTNLIKEIKV